jgi:hypothetical protein
MLKSKLKVKLGATREEEREFLKSLGIKQSVILPPSFEIPEGERELFLKSLGIKQSDKSGSPFTEDSETRKEYPVFSGCLNYFPAALAEVSKLSKEGNDKHNPGEPLHWSRDKSNDHKDCIARHLMDGDWVELAWRALANLQVELENGYEREMTK